MLRRFIVLTLLPAGIALAVTAAVAGPALAKGTTAASITGPGLARPVTLSAPGEGEALPGQGDVLSSLAARTGLFTALFGAGTGTAGEPSPLRTPPAEASLGPEYTVTYTVPGVTPGPGQADGRIRQELYPRAAGGPVIYTPPGQRGFGSPLPVTGWLRATPGLTAILTRLGVPPAGALPSAPAKAKAVPVPSTAARPAGLPAWLIAVIAVAAAAATAGAGTALWLRRPPWPAVGRRVTGSGQRAGERRGATR